MLELPFAKNQHAPKPHGEKRYIFDTVSCPCKSAPPCDEIKQTCLVCLSKLALCVVVRHKNPLNPFPYDKDHRVSYWIYFFLGMLSCEREAPKAEKSDTKIEQGQLFRSVTAQEYAKATPLEKRIIDQLDASVNALAIMAQNNEFANYEAMFTVSTDPSDKFANSIVIAPRENTTVANAQTAAPDGTCPVCGVGSAYSCVGEIREYMDKKHTDHVEIHVHRTNDGCVDISYK